MADNSVIVYMASVSSSTKMASDLQRIDIALGAKKIDYTKIDVASDRTLLDEMRKLVGDPKATPIQFCKGSTYLGNYDAFTEAVENDTLKQFLKLE